MIKFKELSWPLKFAVVAAWVMAILNVIFFLIGFIEGVMLY